MHPHATAIGAGLSGRDAADREVPVGSEIIMRKELLANDHTFRVALDRDVEVINSIRQICDVLGMSLCPRGNDMEGSLSIKKPLTNMCGRHRPSPRAIHPNHARASPHVASLAKKHEYTG